MSNKSTLAMHKRIFIGFVLMVMALLSTTATLYAQEYNRERLRGNVRTINQGGLVPIDSAALLRAKAEAAARRDSLYFSYIDSIAQNEYMLYETLPTTTRDSIRSIVAERVRRDSAALMRGDSISPDGRTTVSASQCPASLRRYTLLSRFLIDLPRLNLPCVSLPKWLFPFLRRTLRLPFNKYLS